MSPRTVYWQLTRSETMCKGMENGTESCMCALGPATFRLKMRVVAAGDAEVRTAGKRECKKQTKKPAR